MKHLFIFTIGPVQSFIAQARKVQDLAAGSKMLSDLTAYAMRYAIEKADADIIFPFYDAKNENANYPNRFVAIVDTQEMQKFGEEIRDYIKDDVFINNAKKMLEAYYDNDKLENALNQLSDFLKIHWAALPYDKDKADYPKQYERIEQLLGGVKNLRVFEQFPEKGRKCAVNGEYNVTIYNHDEEKKKPKWLTYTDKVSVKSKIEMSHLSKGEALSTISFFKRLYKTNSSFNATCEIAYLDVLEINKNKFPNLYKDPQMVFEENRTVQKLEAAQIKKPELDNEIRNITLPKGDKFQKYYAVLVFDADKMGKWMSGKKLRDKTQLRSLQKKLSELLSVFAEFARKELDGKGQAIYTGGDDFLGLVNLRFLFPVLKSLVTKFQEMVWMPLYENFDFGESQEPKSFTFSAGIAIAHYKMPLGFVLNKAREAEKTAKEKGDRNSMSITVLKRSGETLTSYMKWYDEKKHFLPDKMFEIIKTLRRKESSNKFLKSFTAEFLPMSDELSFNSELVKAELQRLLRNNEIEELDEALAILYEEITVEKDRLKEFIEMLNITDFVSRQINNPEN